MGKRKRAVRGMKREVERRQEDEKVDRRKGDGM